MINSQCKKRVGYIYDTISSSLKLPPPQHDRYFLLPTRFINKLTNCKTSFFQTLLGDNSWEYPTRAFRALPTLNKSNSVSRNSLSPSLPPAKSSPALRVYIQLRFKHEIQSIDKEELSIHAKVDAGEKGRDGETGWVGKTIYRRGSAGADTLTGGYKEPRGYLRVDSNDGGRVAPRQISSPIAAEGRYNLIQPGIFFSRLLSPFLSLANTKVDKGEERTSNTVFTAIIIFASYLGPASSYLSFCHGVHPHPLLSLASFSLSLSLFLFGWFPFMSSPACFFKRPSLSLSLSRFWALEHKFVKNTCTKGT